MLDKMEYIKRRANRGARKWAKWGQFGFPPGPLTIIESSVQLTVLQSNYSPKRTISVWDSVRLAV